MENKRGQGLSTNAIIMIILGVAILVILIIGFTYVWGGLGKRISKGNVGTIISACQTACTTQSVYDYCSKSHELISDDGVKVLATCFVLENLDQFNKYGLESCSIGCKGIGVCTDIKYSVGGALVTAALDVKCDKDTSTPAYVGKEVDVSDLATDTNVAVPGNESCCILKVAK